MVKSIYLGTWFPRTSLHLAEIYKYLKSVDGEDDKSLKVSSLKYKEDPIIDHVSGTFEDLIFSITEDGVILVRSDSPMSLQSIQNIEKFYLNRLSPVFNKLFSRGAPLPKELAKVKEIHPYIIVGRDMSEEEIQSIYSMFKEEENSVVKSSDIKISLGNQIDIVNITSSDVLKDETDLEDFIRELIFSREFQLQLNTYLNLHRDIWDSISVIREARDLRYRDFPMVRQKIMAFQKTLSFVEARLAQMDDILVMRNSLLPDNIRTLLSNLSILQYTHLSSSQKYVGHLWQMTKDYADSTIELLESLYQESAQRELNALKFITFIGALTGFFGMNIAFPWEERWPQTAQSAIFVVILIAVVCAVFYLILQKLIYSRRFNIKK